MAKHISVVTKQCAAEKIKMKKTVLEQWIMNGIPWKTSEEGEIIRDKNGEYELDYFPKNIVEFGLWNGSQNTAVARQVTKYLSTTNRSTLYRSHKDDLMEIDGLWQKLEAKALAQLKASSRTYILEGRNEEVEYLRKLCSAQADDITAAALENSRVQTELRRHGRELINLRQRYDEETHQLKQRVSELTSILQKLSPLRKE